MTPEPMIVQHDDRAIYHRRRWERTERSETTSASRTVSNTRTDAIGDAVMIARGVSGELETIPLDAITWKYLFGRCGTKAAIGHITPKYGEEAIAGVTDDGDTL